MSAISPNSPAINTTDNRGTISQKTSKEEGPDISQNAACTGSSSMEKAQANDELKRQLQLEAKVAAAKEALAPLIECSKLTGISLKTVFLAHLLCNIAKIKKNLPKNQKGMPDRSTKMIELQRALMTFLYKKGPEPKESFSLLKQWNSLSELYKNKEEKLVAECDLFFWYLPTLLREYDFSSLKPENPETIHLEKIEQHFGYYFELLSLAEYLCTRNKNGLTEFKNAAKETQKAKKIQDDSIDVLFSKIESFLHRNEKILKLLKDHPFFAFNQKMAHVSIPKMEFLEIAHDFTEKCQVHNSHYYPLFLEIHNLAQSHTLVAESIAYTLLRSSASMSERYGQFYTNGTWLLQILIPLNTHFSFIQKHFLSLFQKQSQILEWKNLNFPKQNIFRFNELFFLYFFQCLEALPDSKEKISMEKKIFELNNLLNLSYTFIETYTAEAQSFSTIYLKLCSLVNECRTSLRSSGQLEMESPFQAFALFADFLEFSPQSLSLLYCSSLADRSNELIEQNQKFLILHLKFYRRYITLINYGEIQQFLDSVQNPDNNIQTLRASIQKYVTSQKWRQKQLLNLIPQEIPIEELNSIVKNLKTYFDIFCDNNEDNLDQAGIDLNQLEELLNTEVHISTTINMAALAQGFWSFGTPILHYFEQEFPETQTKKPDLKISSFTKPKVKKEKETSVSATTSLGKIQTPEITIFEALSLQTRAKIHPLKLVQESALNASLRRIQLEISLENIEYYRSLLSELLEFSDPLSFPLSFGHLMQLLPLLTLEQSTKAVLSHLPYTYQDDPLTHVLFREIPHSSNKTLTRSSHNVQKLWELLELKDSKSFRTSAEQKKHLSDCSFSIISSRYPLYRKTTESSSALYAALLSGSKKNAFKILQELPQKTLVSLTLSQKALSLLAKPASFSKGFSASFTTLTLIDHDPRIKELLNLKTKFHPKLISWLDHFASENLSFALMLTNEMLLCKERLKVPQCYAQMLSSAPFLVLELSTLLCESLLKLKNFGTAAQAEWESHDLSDFPNISQTKILFTPEEKALFEMAQSVLKSETRYPKAIYGKVSEDLLKLQTLCQWREAVKPNGWKTEEMLYEMKSAYKKEVSANLLKEIERDITEILDRIQARAEQVLSISKKVLSLIE